MKYARLSLLLILPLLSASCGDSSTADAPAAAPEERPEEREPSDPQLFNLLTYTFADSAQARVADRYFEQALLPALHERGVESIGVFGERPSDDGAPIRTFVLVPYRNPDRYLSVRRELRLDSIYQKNGADFLAAAPDTPPYERVSSVLLEAFSEMPTLRPTEVTGPRRDRIYELRSYQSPNEERYRSKLKMFNEGGEVALFDTLGFNAVFYGDVVDGPETPNLMYMTTFPDRATRDSLWNDFGSAPAWAALKGDTQYADNVSHIDIYFLYPTDYSDY